MKVREIVEKVRSGEISLVYAGHRVRMTKNDFLKYYEKVKDDANGASNGKCGKRENETVEQVNAGMREFYNRRLEFEVEQNKSLSFTMDERCECSGCGVRLNWVLVGNNLQLLDHPQKSNKKPFNVEFVNYPVDYVCPFHILTPTKGEITVASKLIFANFFAGIEDTPKGKKYSDEYSLQHAAGLEKITKYKSKRNVAFGQMSNMSIGIFVHPDNRSIIIGNSFDSESESDDEERLIIDGHKLVGEISLAVWRWEATDFNTLGKKGYKKLKKDELDIVEVDAEYGVWEFEHYFENQIGDFETIYSRLRLKC